MADVAVIDIDGVVADVRHRLHHLQRPGPGRWDAFFRAAARDKLLPEGAALVEDLARTQTIVWLTGRPEHLRAVTEDWLSAHGLPAGRLLMRPNSDRRPAVDYKRSALRRLAAEPDIRITALVDDDNAVIEAARADGLPAVLADWVSRSDILRIAQDRRGRT